MTDWNEHDRQVLEDKPEVLADIHRFIDHTVQFRARILRQYDVP
jgi:hypothetical protein